MLQNLVYLSANFLISLIIDVPSIGRNNQSDSSIKIKTSYNLRTSDKDKSEINNKLFGNNNRASSKDISNV